MSGLLEDLAINLGISAIDLMTIIDSAPKRYKVYTIPKRNGGNRIIAQPSRELKSIQREILNNIISKLPVHKAAMAYKNGVGIVENAHKHLNSKIILKLDFNNFFNSLKIKDWNRFANASLPNLTYNEKRMLGNILFWGNGKSSPQCLSVGAPTSPMLSNILLYQLDQKISDLSILYKVKYTRYADDITLSSRDVQSVLQCEKQIRKLVKTTKSPKLIFNDKKRGVFSSANRRMVTGLIITPDKVISIGRDRKRAISSMLHRISMGEKEPEYVLRTKGYLGFAIACEPEFVERLRNKYGDALINGVLRYQFPN